MPRPGKELPSEYIESINLLVDGGSTVQQIAEQAGVSLSTASKYRAMRLASDGRPENSDNAE